MPQDDPPANVPAPEKKGGVSNIGTVITSLATLIIAITGLVKACSATEKAESAHGRAAEAQAAASSASTAAASASVVAREATKMAASAQVDVKRLQDSGSSYTPTCAASERPSGKGHCPVTLASDATQLCAIVLERSLQTGVQFDVAGKSYRVEAYPEHNQRYWGVTLVSDTNPCKAADCSCTAK